MRLMQVTIWQKGTETTMTENGPVRKDIERVLADYIVRATRIDTVDDIQSVMLKRHQQSHFEGDRAEAIEIDPDYLEEGYLVCSQVGEWTTAE